MAGCCESGAESPNSKNAGSFLTSWSTGKDGLLCMELGMQLNTLQRTGDADLLF